MFPFKCFQRTEGQTFGACMLKMWISVKIYTVKKYGERSCNYPWNEMIDKNDPKIKLVWKCKIIKVDCNYDKAKPPPI